MSKNSSESFVLENREEVIKFEKHTQSYMTNKGLYPLQHLSLVKAYDHCQKRGCDMKLFYILLDIYINFTLLYCDMSSANQGKLVGENVFETEDHFFEKMDLHRFYSSFIFRYRALWDKLMGFLVLLCVSEEQYEKYTKARSRISRFESICKDFNVIPAEFVKQVVEVVTKFDEKFRTPEAHGAGSLRKWSFLMASSEDAPVDDLLGYWNEINNFMVAIGGMFDALEESVK